MQRRAGRSPCIRDQLEFREIKHGRLDRVIPRLLHISFVRMNNQQKKRPERVGTYIIPLDANFASPSIPTHGYPHSLREMTIDTCSQTLPFSIENAFTDRLEGGNPAAVVHLPSLNALPDETLQTIAANFNQPMTVFIAPLAPHDENTIDPSSTGGTDDTDRTGTTLRLGIRWFTTKLEVALCGHATLAAAASIFRGARGGAEADAKGPVAIRFEATSGKFLVARKVEEDRVEIDLDSETAEALPAEEDAKLRGVLAKALGKDVPLKYVGRGAGHLSMYALIEADTLDLKHLNVNTDAFVSASRWLWGRATLLMNAGLGSIQLAREPFHGACRRRAVVCPWSSIRISNVCSGCWGQRGSCMWHGTYVVGAILDGRERPLWSCVCKAGQRARGGS